MSTLDDALAYAARGWRVHPLPPGLKYPKGYPAWQNDATTDPATIRTWWTTNPGHGVCIATGRASGVWVLDVDVAEGKSGDESLAQLEDAYEPLPDTYEVVTGSGGRHLYFAWPNDPSIEIRNDQSGRIGAGLDVRADGGQVLAPPTIHPNGQPYEREASSPDELAQAPAWLVAMVSAQEEPAPRAVPQLVPAGDRPGDLWAAATTWDDLLAADGWQRGGPSGDGGIGWVRPGKDRRDGISATVDYKGADTLKVFTSSHPHLEAERTYTKLGYLAAVRFGGDHSQAAAWCRSQGHVSPTSPHGDVRDLVGGAAPADWPDPKPLPAPPPPEPFPVEVLPDWAQAHAVAAADQVQVPVDLAAMLIIGSLAAAATGRAVVDVSPNWSEPTNLYLVTAMRSGAGKSPCEKLCVDWLRTWQRQRIAAAAPAWEEATTRLKLAEKVVANLERNSTGDNLADIMAAKAKVNAARELVPVLPRLLADDATPQAVAMLLHSYGERLAIMSTEADLFDMVMRGKPGQRSEINVYLKSWSGDALMRDRKGGTETGPEAADLANPLLTVAITVQPSVIARLQADDEMVSRGFAARFMYSMPQDLIGQRDQGRRFDTQRLTTLDAYNAAATALADRWGRWSHAAHMRITTGATAELRGFLDEIEPQLAAEAAYANLSEWANKLHASIARYAGILHLAEGNEAAVPITTDTMSRAVRLGRYWLAHATAVLGLHVERTAEQADAILTYVAEQATATITPSEIQKGLRRPSIGLDKVADFVPALELLIDLGWLRSTSTSDWRADVGIRGAKSPTLEVAPCVIGQPQRAKVSRAQSIASKGERVLSLSPPPSKPQPPSRDALNSRNSQGDDDPLAGTPWAVDATNGAA